MDALLEQLFRGINPVVLAWYRDRTGIAQKMQYLEMLIYKIRSVVEQSERIKIKGEDLRKLQQILKDAATEGDEVLHKLQDQVNSSSSSSSGVCTFFVRFFSQKEDVEKLRRTIEMLEQFSAQVEDFFFKILEYENKLDLGKKRKRPADHKKKEGRKEKRKEAKKVDKRDDKKDEKKVDKRDDKRDEKKDGKADSEWYRREEHMAFQSPFPRTGVIDLHRLFDFFPRFVIPVSKDNALRMTFPGWLEPSTSGISIREQALSQLPDHSDTDSKESEKLEEEEEKDKSPLMGKGKDKDSFKEMGKLVSPNLDPKEKGVLVSPNPLQLLPWRDIENTDSVKEMAFRILRVVRNAKQKNDDDSWFNGWSAKLTEAAKEADSIASAIQSNNYIVHDQIADEVAFIVTRIRHRLNRMCSDLDDFSNLAEVEKLARELTPGPSAHKKWSFGGLIRSLGKYAS